MELFTTPEVREQFIIGITEIISQIYSITDSQNKRNIFDELSALNDEKLIQKKDFIEAYLKESTQLTQSCINKMMQAEHFYEEEEERKVISMTF